jgi:hypothetical protein
MRLKHRGDGPRPTVANTLREPKNVCTPPCRSPAQKSFYEQTSRRSVYLAVRLRAPLPPLTLRIWGISAWIAFLQASLSSAFLCLRQVVISSASGMKALHSLNTSGVHAMRCSGVPSEAGVGEAVAHSKASDINDRARGSGRSSVHLSWLSMFINGLTMVIEADTRLHHGKYRTRLREIALVAKRQRL